MTDGTNRSVKHYEWWTMSCKSDELDFQLTELVNSLPVASLGIATRIEWLDKVQVALRSLHQLQDCMDIIERRHDSEL